ncbi:hypothetical protein GCM10020358_55410 [Amorphoplanes nipponensis]|uniref:Uncharacterized protein n=1 Tax=Actinoplanes nipponensis TaxID=135950 RepID=A0A919JS04_9ACTN|nr:hypothetical protein Ani05nite_77300 [Actinoplanes nipponensis]
MIIIWSGGETGCDGPARAVPGRARTASMAVATVLVRSMTTPDETLTEKAEELWYLAFPDVTFHVIARPMNVSTKGCRYPTSAVRPEFRNGRPRPDRVVLGTAVHG